MTDRERNEDIREKHALGDTNTETDYQSD